MEGEGLIVRRPGSGAYVSDRTGVASSGLDSASPAKIMEARLTIEPPMAMLVARNATAADFSAMDRCVVAGRAATSLESFEHWDASLHEAIASATGNPLVAAAYRLVTRARETSEWGALKRKSLTPAARAAYQADHERIVEALRQRDVDAASEALRSHLIDIRKNLLGE